MSVFVEGYVRMYVMVSFCGVVFCLGVGEGNNGVVVVHSTITCTATDKNNDINHHHHDNNSSSNSNSSSNKQQQHYQPWAVALIHAEHLPKELRGRLGPLQDPPSLRDPRCVPLQDTAGQGEEGGVAQKMAGMSQCPTSQQPTLQPPAI